MLGPVLPAGAPAPSDEPVVSQSNDRGRCAASAAPGAAAAWAGLCSSTLLKWLHCLHKFCSLAQVAQSGGARVMVLQVLLQGLHVCASCRCRSSQRGLAEELRQQVRRCAAAAVVKTSSSTSPFFIHLTGGALHRVLWRQICTRISSTRPEIRECFSRMISILRKMSATCQLWHAVVLRC